MSGKRPTLQELIRRRQASAFVGRQQQLSLFEESLGLPVDDPRRRFLFSIHGDAGIGKTYLVRQLMRLARERSCRTAYVDEAMHDVISVLESMAAELERQGARFGDLRGKLETYRERRRELDSDPGAPDGLSAVLTRSAVRVGLRAAGDVPFVGGFAEELDADALADQVDRLRVFLSRRFRNHDDVQLLLNPVGALTPVFLRELNEAAEDGPVALFFDTYERTAGYLEPWLLEVLLGVRYGALPGNLALCVSGQLPLDVNRWGEYLSIRADMPLEVFTESEARTLLVERGVTDERVTEVIIKLSGRLPLLVAMLAEARPETADLVGDPSGNAVERFLKWESDEERRNAALYGALPVRLNRDIFAVATGSAAPEQDFARLCRLPFVVEHADGFRYHQFVRTAMLRVLRRTAPREWQRRHVALAEHYATERAALELTGRQAWTDDLWQHLALDEAYHRLGARASGIPAEALATLVNAIAWYSRALPDWALAFGQAGEETGNTGLTRMATLLAAWPDGPEAKLRLLSELINDPNLDEHSRGMAFGERGKIYGGQDEHDRALTELGAALELVPDAYWLTTARGIVHLTNGDHGAALRDLDRALELEPGDPTALIVRGTAYAETNRVDEALADFNSISDLEDDKWAFQRRAIAYHDMGRYDEELADLTRAIEIDPENVWSIQARGRTYWLVGRYDEALADLTRAIEIDPEDDWTIAHRGATYRSMGRHDEALTDYNRAIELDPEYTWAISGRIGTYWAMGRYDEALADCGRAIELDPGDAWAFANRGETHRGLRRFAEAITDFDRAIELNPEFGWAIRNRGFVHRMLGSYQDSLADFNRAVELDPRSTWALVGRGTAYEKMGRYDEAFRDFNHAIEINPGDDWAIHKRAEIHRRAGRLDDALADFDRAVELDPSDPWNIAERGETHRIAGRLDQAIADLHRAVELDVDSESGSAHFQLALCMNLKQEPERAREHLDRALEIEHAGLARGDEPVGRRFNIAICLLAGGDREAAEEQVRQALEAGQEYGDLTTVLIDFADLHAALGTDVSGIVERIQRAIDQPIDERS